MVLALHIADCTDDLPMPRIVKIQRVGFGMRKVLSVMF